MIRSDRRSLLPLQIVAQFFGGFGKRMLGASGGPFDPLHRRGQFLPYRDGSRSPMIAISYRREDSTSIAGRLHDRPRAEFGKENVFMDFEDFRPLVDCSSSRRASSGSRQDLYR